MTDLANFYSLSRGERDLFVAVAQYNDIGETPTGTATGDRVQELRGGERPANDTIYDGLTALADHGLIDCKKVNERRSAYEITKDGQDVLDAVADELPARH